MGSYTYILAYVIYILRSVYVLEYRWSATTVAHLRRLVLREGAGHTPIHVRVEALLVRWAPGKRLTSRLPKLSLKTLSPPLNSGILGLRMGPYVPTPKFFTIWGPREEKSYCIRFFTWGNLLYFKKRFHGGRDIRTHDQRPMVCRRRHLWRH